MGFELGLSNPCFELWLWLHENDANASLTDAKSLKNALAFDMHEWNKDPKADWIREAVRRAEALPGSTAEPFPDNPGTQLGALFRHLGFGEATV